MSEDLQAIVASAVAATKEAPPDLDTASAIADAGDIVGTATPDDAAESTAVDIVDADAAGPGAPAKEPVAAAEPKVEEADEFAREHELKTKDTIGRENRIPYSRVKKISENAAAKAVAPLRAELETVRTHNTEYQRRLEKIANVEHIMFNDKPRFIEMLRTIGYDDTLLGGKSPAPASTNAPAAAAEAPGEIDWAKAPAPDEDGSYSAAGLQKLLGWTIEQASARATVAAEARLGKRYEPIERTFKDQEAAREAEGRLAGFVNSTMTDAREWAHFAENENDILKALQEDSAQAAKGGTLKYAGRAALRKAYEHVVFGRITSDRQKVRESVLSELEKAPRSTSAGGSRIAAAVDTEPEAPGLAGLENVVRAAVRAHQGRA